MDIDQFGNNIEENGREKMGRPDEDPGLESRDLAEDPSLEQGEEAEEPGEQEAQEETAEEDVTPQDVPILEEPVQRRGCLRGCLTPIAVVFVLLIALAIIGYSKRDALNRSLLNRTITNVQNRVLSEQPEDEKLVEETFDKVKLALKENRVDREALTEAIEGYLDAMRERPPDEQKKQEISKLIDSLNAAIRDGEK